MKFYHPDGRIGCGDELPGGCIEITRANGWILQPKIVDGVLIDQAPQEDREQRLSLILEHTEPEMREEIEAEFRAFDHNN